MNIGKMMEFQYDLKSKLISNYKLLKAVISFRRNIFKNKDNNIIIEDLRNIKDIEILEVNKHYE